MMPAGHPGSTRMAVETVNPATGKVEHRQELMDAAAIEQLLDAAEQAFPAWSSRSLAGRGDCLRAVAGVLRERRASIAAVMTA